MKKLVLVAVLSAIVGGAHAQPTVLSAAQLGQVTAGGFNFSRLGASAFAFATCTPSPCAATTYKFSVTKPGLSASAISTSTSGWVRN